jgi:hypothetical protein
MKSQRVLNWSCTMKTERILIAVLMLGLMLAVALGRGEARERQPANQPDHAGPAPVSGAALLSTDILLATADAMVDAVSPDWTPGRQCGVSVGYDATLDFIQWRALIRFDLSGIPAGTAINEARLQLYVLDTWPADDVTVEVARMTEDWDEATVSWDTGHQDTIADLQPPVTKVVGLSTGVWVEWDVTSLAQSWLDGGFPNYGLVLHGPEWATEYGRGFASRECADGLRTPRLVVNYGPAEPASDLAVDDVEITQGIQCLDNTVGDTACADNSIPLVEGRPTWVRVFVDTGAAVADVHNVNSRLKRMIGGQPVYVYAFNGPIVAKPTPSRWRTNDTLNFLLPHEWWTGAYSFDVELDPDNLLDETNEGNNSRTVDLSFNARQSLTIYYSPIYYDPEADGGAILPTNRIHTAYRWLYNIFPLADYPTYIEQPTYLWQSDVTVDDNSAALMNFLYQLWTLDGKRDSTAYKQIYAGWLPAAGEGVWTGLSDPLYGGGTGIPVIVTDTDGRYRKTLAHEIGHDFNLRHTYEDDDWPYVDDQIQEYGFNIERRYVADGLQFDFMTGASEDWSWISPYNYRNLYDWLGAPALASQALAAEEPVERALITGFIRRNGTGKLNALYRYQALSPAGATPPGTDFCLRFRDAGDALLAERCFDVAFAAIDNDEPYNTAPFGMLEPWPPNTARVQLTKAATILDHLTVSANPPSVQIDQPNGGELWGETGLIKWHGSDPDGDPLAYAVLYSADEGVSWLSLASQLSTTELQVDTTVLPGSDRALIRVLATDGARTAEDRSDGTFSVARKPPTATIFLPENGERFDLGDPVLLRGVGYDREDGRLQEGALTWTSDRDGLVGSGGTLVTIELSVGRHRLTFEVRDTDSNVAQDTVEIDIVVAGADQRKVYLPLVFRDSGPAMPSLPPTLTATYTPTPTSTPSATPTATPTPVTVSLTPVADAYIYSAAPATNYGAAPTLYVGSQSTSATGRALFRFDLSAIPPGVTVQSAMFQAYLAQSSSTPATLDVELKRIDTNWQEDKVIWNDALSYTGANNVLGVGMTLGYTSWDVTSLVQTWVSGAPNRGLALMSKNESTLGWRGFASKEGASPPNPPRLVVTYRP